MCRDVSGERYNKDFGLNHVGPLWWAFRLNGIQSFIPRVNEETTAIGKISRVEKLNMV